MTAVQHLLASQRTRHPVAGGGTRGCTLGVGRARLTRRLGTGNTRLVASLAASGMATAHLASFLARITRSVAVATLGATVSTGGIVPAALLLAYAMVLFRNLALFSCIATETEAVASMATNAMTSTHAGARIVGGGDVFVVLGSHRVITTWNVPGDLFHAADRSRILSFPTPG